MRQESNPITNNNNKNSHVDVTSRRVVHMIEYMAEQGLPGMLMHKWTPALAPKTHFTHTKALNVNRWDCLQGEKKKRKKEKKTVRFTMHNSICDFD